MKIKKIFIFISIIITIAAAVLLALFYVNQSHLKLTYSSQTQNESSALLPNPYIGFYHLYGFSLSDESCSEAEKLAEKITQNKTNSLALLEINLKNFRTKILSENALSQLETLLIRCENSNKKLILRFLYDWDGKAKTTEPDNLSQIITHIEQVSPIINNHKNAVYIMQGIFVGNCGEMNGTVYMSKDNMLTLINNIDKNIDKDIFLAVRTPAHYRTITDLLVPPDNTEAFSGELRTRLGLFNDGMLGSDTDLGTYGTSSFKGTDKPSDKGTRSEEIEFQNKLCSFVPNGGECVVDNQFNDFNNAVNDLKNMHISYLNCDYDSAVLNKWRQDLFTEEGAFKNTNGYDYIASHLGYRYFVSASNLTYNRSKDTTAALNITINNSGFAPAYKKFKSKLTLVNGTDNKEYNIDFDNRLLKSDSKVTISAKINTADLTKGTTYKIYFEMEDNSSIPAVKINFANEQLSENYSAIFLGELNVK